jgi:hypothetical protein
VSAQRLGVCQGSGASSSSSSSRVQHSLQSVCVGVELEIQASLQLCLAQPDLELAAPASISGMPHSVFCQPSPHLQRCV